MACMGRRRWVEDDDGVKLVVVVVVVVRVRVRVRVVDNAHFRSHPSSHIIIIPLPRWHA